MRLIVRVYKGIEASVLVLFLLLIIQAQHAEMIKALELIEVIIL